ncbi:MAG TPA: hypothetical protein ENJ24_05210 [Gammaproteobacteria bacterium]|nr:hypothetical protein [Gammaproteobacteria bacterium]
MRVTRRLYVFVILSMLLLTACGGGGDGTTGPVAPSNASPQATIDAPASGTIYAEGSNVLLQGSASDAEDGALSGTRLSWSSSRDGALGTGESVTANEHIVSPLWLMADVVMNDVIQTTSYFFNNRICTKTED